ncbi:double-strand break repair protein AddB [Sphingomonas sp. NSE70-1]|uniref:Double-strand break repair protein AddB n=1 Tax=Sphingomonas caseinilyticus TaxID=2908205 RepID=A0ABT0RRG7_9SPHN|nr:double-strand break repair protein AddB [Sphingomonas caseinilyticus]MCL6697614.1 double-strand break repair protein AddB [Sphingomonas caseinilyticus]
MADIGLFERRVRGSPLVYSIPAYRSFADALVHGLLAALGRNPLALAHGRILLPNSRAVRSVTEAFVRASKGGLVLPRLIVVGDQDIGERIGGALDPLELADEIPVAIEPLERQLLLAQMLRSPDEGAAEAMRLAVELARTMDQLAIEEVAASKLNDAVAGSPELAGHWLHSIDRFRAIMDRWPALLADRGLIDLADRRSKLLHALTRRWATHPPGGFTLAAGITTSAPAIAALLGRIARLDQGAVVLPGLATIDTVSSEEWDALGPDEDGKSEQTHPQHHLKRLLSRIEVAREEVLPWPGGGRASSTRARGLAVANALVSPAFSEKWTRLTAPERRLTGIKVAELPDPASEAQAIAIALRESIETPGKTAALVTPDRALAARVSAHLQRWGIEADDSAGQPLSHSPAGTLLLAVAAAAIEKLAPVALLSLLKHPLVGTSGERGEPTDLGSRREWLETVRVLDLALRGPRPPAGIEGLDERFAEKKVDRAWTAVRPLVAPLSSATFSASMADAAATLRELAQQLAGDMAWRGTDGRLAAELLGQLEQSSEASLISLAPEDIIPIFRGLMDGLPVRRPFGGHPRVFIWGLLEARLQKADLMILGGMNEGSWPTSPDPDPWLPPQIRKALGLPGIEFRTGLAAHDFMSALGAPRVLLTRARNDGRSPTIASRLWLRLQAMTGGMTRDQRLERLALALDASSVVKPVGRPAPRPPFEARPKRIAVTDLDRLKADPFAFYAKAVLGLRPLESVDEEHHAAWKGTAVHEVLEAWFKEDDCDPAKLRSRAEAMIASETIHPMLRTLWAPRLMEAIDWIAKQVAADRAAGRLPVVAESKGEAKVAGVLLHGRVDRIDRLQDGKLAIIDYKTGQAPAKKAVAEGFALQLGLLSLIARAGGFGGAQGDVACHEYWSLAKKNGQLGYRQSPDKDDGPDAFVERAYAQFAVAAADYLLGTREFEAKLNPAYAPYEDYDQLMRLEEWYGRE